MITAVFPGTFDPPTYGHLNIIERAASLFDSLHVLVARNIQKTNLLDTDLRQSLLIQESARLGLENVEVHITDSLVVDYCKKSDAQLIIRGLRSPADFSYELEMGIINNHISDRSIQTVFLPVDPRFLAVRSSTVREMLRYNQDLSSLVPDSVIAALGSKHLTK